MSYIKDVPKYGFGTAFRIGEGPGRISQGQFKGLVRHAIKLGVRHFDCAPSYGTQKLVGEVLKEFRNEIPRTQFFVTSKLPVNMMRYQRTDRSIKRTLIELQLNYLDLFLIHAPFATKFITEREIYPMDQDGNVMIDDEDDDLLEQTWIKLIDLKEKGYVKYIGLSNVNEGQLDRLNKIHQVDVVQNEYHLYNQDRIFFDHCEEVDVHFEAYAAFGCPQRARNHNLPTFHTDPTVDRIARENNLTNPEVIVQWLHQQPLSYVIRTDNISQLEENFRATKSVILSLNDMIDLDTLNKRARLYYFDFKNMARHPEYPFKKMTIQ